MLNKWEMCVSFRMIKTTMIVTGLQCMVKNSSIVGIKFNEVVLLNCLDYRVVLDAYSAWPIGGISMITFCPAA